MAQRKKAASPDVALLYAPTDDGHGARVIRARDGLLETGEVRPVRDGQPINQGELVRLSPRGDAPCVCDVEVLYPRPTEPGADAEHRASGEVGAAESRVPTARGRPAQVASDDYRINWDRIFGPAGRRAKGDRSLN
jgi:hypothetical protein